MDRNEYLFKQHENILGWYKLSEEKARFLVTVNSVGVGVVNGLIFLGSDKIKVITPPYIVALWIAVAICGVALLLSYFLILEVHWSRHMLSKDGLRSEQRLWFFGDVAAMTYEEHQKAMREWTPDRAEETMIAQNQILSENVKKKFDSVNHASVLTTMAFVFVFVLGVVYAMAITP